MDYSIIIALVLFSKGWCKIGTLISFNGCFKGSELRDDEKNNSIFIEQNYPGLCLQTCIHQEHTHPLAVALQGTSCLCLNRTNTMEAGETETRDCTETCPGHDELYCGHTSIDCFSSYSLGFNTINSGEEELCAANLKGTSQVTMHNCSDSHPTFCYDLAGNCEELKTSANWSQELLECTGIGLQVQYYTKVKKAEIDLCPDPLDVIPVYYGTTPTFWIQAFGQNAPKVPCPKLMVPAHGNITYTANPRIAVYSCESGFELIPNGTRLCLANRTWNGTTPICQKVEVTTTHITATSAETTADTDTQTLTTDMPIDATTSSPVSETTTSTLVSTSSPSTRFSSSPASSNSTLLTSASPSTETRSPMAKLAGSSSESNNGRTIGIVVGVVIGICIVVSCVSIWCIFKKNRCRRKNKVSPSNNEKIGNKEEDVQENTTVETRDNNEISVTVEHANGARDNYKRHENLTQERDGESRNSSNVTSENNESGGKVVSVKDACNDDKDHEQLTLGKDDENIKTNYTGLQVESENIELFWDTNM